MDFKKQERVIFIFEILLRVENYPVIFAGFLPFDF